MCAVGSGMILGQVKETETTIINIPQRERGGMIETHTYLTNIYNTDNPCMILEADSNTRGHNLKLTKQRSMTDLRIHCFSNRIVNNWNSLPDHVVAADTLNAFRARLDKLWKNRRYEVDTWGHTITVKESSLIVGGT